MMENGDGDGDGDGNTDITSVSFVDVSPFLFYVLVELDDEGYHIVGYFSKVRQDLYGDGDGDGDGVIF